MKSRWDESEAKAALERWAPRWGADLALRVYSSRLLGADPSLVLHGGGNTSVKVTAREISGESVDVVYVKGSGWDLSRIEPEGFPACRLEPLLRALALPKLDDESMVRALRSQMLDPASPTPSVEALLHAFIPARVVDHTHADAVLAIVDQPDGAERAREVWGADAIVVPYVMPGFLLARKVAELGDRLRSASVMVLDKHGIFTWGESARDSYERMIAAVTRAEEYVARARAKTPSAPRIEAGVEARGSSAGERNDVEARGSSAGERNDVEARGSSAGERNDVEARARRERQRQLAPLVRGALARAEEGAPFVLSWRDEPEILALLARADARDVTAIGTITPDHVLRTKPIPAWLGHLPASGDLLPAAIDRELARYGAWYASYFTEHAPRSETPLTRLDRLPRVLVAPGLGALVIGRTRDEAQVAGDVYAHTAATIDAAMAIGRYAPVSHADLFDVEYWSLEQAKLKSAKPLAGPLARRIALVTGAARGIGRASAAHLLELGAHVLVSDADAEALSVAERELSGRFGARVAAAPADVTSTTACAELIARAVELFGGLDVVVSNAGNAPSGLLHSERGDLALRRSLELNLLGHQNVARAATDLLLAQGMGGCLLFNASKSAFNPGKEFGPYAVPKAALIALMRQYAVDLGAHGIRANAVNADRIRTALFDDIIEERARARGVSPDEYFRDNLLRRETIADDVARAFGYLASASATTGAVITVDGGNAAAFPR